MSTANQLRYARKYAAKAVEATAHSAEDGLEVAVGQTAKLIAKVMCAKGFVYGTVLSGTAAEDHAVDGASFIANGHARVLPPFPCLEPMAGVCLYEGQEVLVIGPWLVTFDQLCTHGFLSEVEAQQLKTAARRVSRDFYRVLQRKNAAIRAEWDATHGAHFSAGSTGDATGDLGNGD